MPKYYVAYVAKRNGDTSFNKKIVNLSAPIRTEEDIGNIERDISGNLLGSDVTVLGCIPLEE